MQLCHAGLRSKQVCSSSSHALIRRGLANRTPQPPPHPRVHGAPSWRPPTVLDEYVQRPARPVSLRQLTFFGRNLTEERLIASANYVREELPVRIAHRIRDMQNLPYVFLTNPHLAHIYDIYYRTFDVLRKVPVVKSVEDNDKLCEVIESQLRENLSVIPSLAMAVIELEDMQGIRSGDNISGSGWTREELDDWMGRLLRSRISRRVIGEQHLALTDTFHSPYHFPDIADNASTSHYPDYIGEVFLKCNAADVVMTSAELVANLAKDMYGPGVALPEVIIEGHKDATFPYILSHLAYILGEILRNSFMATVDFHRLHGTKSEPPPAIRVLVCHAPQHIIFRISDQGGGIPPAVLPAVWSFSKGPTGRGSLDKTHSVTAGLEELITTHPPDPQLVERHKDQRKGVEEALAKGLGSLSGLTERPPGLRLGLGLAMSRVYAEYWAGRLELHSLDGYGTDVFLQISKLGNKHEQIANREVLDRL